MLSQELIDKIGDDSITDGYEDTLHEAIGMFLVDEEIEDLADAQDDLLHSGLNETGRLIDIVDIEAE